MTLAAAGALLCAANAAYAITVAGTNAAGSYTGVAELLIARPDLGPGALKNCSGSLLADGYSILTAAHCIADGRGIEQATSAYVFFNLSGGTYLAEVADFHVDPDYDGSILSPSDVAVLSMPAPAPPDANRYDLYDGTAFDQMITLAGYPIHGTGAVHVEDGGYPFGKLRVGTNQYVGYLAPNVLGFDVDRALAAADALGTDFAASGPGEQNQEALVLPDDSGGPSFINGRIAGVHSFVGHPGADILGILNSSSGEYAGDDSTVYNASFIEAMLVTPEPNTMFTLGFALVAFSLLMPKRRRKDPPRRRFLIDRSSHPVEDDPRFGWR